MRASVQQDKRFERLGDRPGFDAWVAEVEAVLDLRREQPREPWAQNDDRRWWIALLRFSRRARLQ